MELELNPYDLLSRPVIALSTVGGFTAFVASMTLLLSTPFRLTHEYGLTAAAVRPYSWVSRKGVDSSSVMDATNAVKPPTVDSAMTGRDSRS